MLMTSHLKSNPVNLAGMNIGEGITIILGALNDNSGALYVSRPLPIEEILRML